MAARVWASLEGPRALFDRAVVWLVDNRVLLPGITTLTRLVAEVRAAENAALYRTLEEAVPDELRQSMRDLLKVPEGKWVSELERLRTPPMRVSGTAMTAALERAKDVRGSAPIWWGRRWCRRRGWRGWRGTGWVRRRRHLRSPA